MELKERRKLINSKIPKKYQSNFHRLLRLAGHAAFTSRSEIAMNPKTLERCVCIFASMLEWKNDDYQNITPRQFVLAALTLGYAGEGEAIYQDLSHNAQKFFVNMTEEAGASSSGSVVLSILKRLESVPDAPLMTPRARSAVPLATTTEMSLRSAITLALEEVVANSETPGIESRLDLKYPSEDFLKLMKAKTTPALNSIDRSVTDILFLWKLHYGEQTVSEFYSRFKEYYYPLKCNQMFAILDNWSDLEDYPVDWIVSLHPSSL